MVTSNVKIKGRHLIDTRTEQVLNLRGFSISGHSKLPSKPDGRTHQSESLLDHTKVSFIDHPLKLNEARHYLTQLLNWGYNLIRLVIVWESLEHEGPGIYDTDYVEYIVGLVKICQDLDLKVVIDAHQDVWSRLCGGSGAPGWTLELVGFEIGNLSLTGAAALQQLGAPKGVWPSGYQKLAAGTMFTLFFGGDYFAPNRKVPKSQHRIWALEDQENSGGSMMISLQEFLQNSMCQAFGILADALAEFDCVIGFEPMNEPHRGFINLHSPYGWNPTTDLFLHDCPSFLQSVALGEGHSQKVDVYTPTWPIPSIKFHRRELNSKQIRAWKSKFDCIWKEHQIWDWDSKKQKPIILKPNHFNLDHQTGLKFDFYRQSLFPFVCKFAERVQRLRPDWLIPVGPIPNEFYPSWDPAQRPKNLIAGPHFYDLFSLVHKSHGEMTLDVQAICNNKPIWKWIYFGHEAAKRNYAQQIKNTIDSVYKNIGEIPCLIGEAGICMDQNRGEAFKSGNFYWQERQMDALFSGLESNLVSFVIWNFDPYNTDEFGDGWNGENFSFISQSTNKSDTNAGGFSQPRILNSIKVEPPNFLFLINRPFARKVSGIPIQSQFEMKESSFEFEFKDFKHASNSIKSDQENQTQEIELIEEGETEIYLPRDRYPIGKTKIEVSDGTFHYDHQNQMVIWKLTKDTRKSSDHWIKIKSSIRLDQFQPIRSYTSLLILGSSLVLGLISVYWFSG